MESPGERLREHTAPPDRRRNSSPFAAWSAPPPTEAFRVQNRPEAPFGHSKPRKGRACRRAFSVLVRAGLEGALSWGEPLPDRAPSWLVCPGPALRRASKPTSDQESPRPQRQLDSRNAAASLLRSADVGR